MSITLIAVFVLSGLIMLVFFVIFKTILKDKESDRQQGEAILNLERRLSDLMSNQLKEIRDNVTVSSSEMNRQIRSFTEEAVTIRENLKQIQTQVQDVSSFQDIFKAPKLRGQWGEASLDHILSQRFPEELYESQHLFSSGEQVDAILKLPNGKILPIDAKFPLENFDKMINSQTDLERSGFKKTFLDDVKVKIQDIAQKYILPGEGTTDFALMYIPAEAVYYEIVNNLNKEIDITALAWSKKVIVTSPNTIYLTLWTIEHWFRDTKISKDTQEIVKRLGKIHHDAEKLMDDFRKLGSHLRNATTAYDESEKRLSLFNSKVEKIIDTGEKEKIEPPVDME
ncbi:MAG: DNA recombination protein RmuC [bacterium]